MALNIEFRAILNAELLANDFWKMIIVLSFALSLNVSFCN